MQAFVELDDNVALGEAVYLGDDNKIHPFKKEWERCNKCGRFTKTGYLTSYCCGDWINRPPTKRTLGRLVTKIDNTHGWIEVYV